MAGSYSEVAVPAPGSPPKHPTEAPKTPVFNGFSRGGGVKNVKYAPLGVQMAIIWVGPGVVIRDLVTRCLVFQYPGGLNMQNVTWC